MSFTSTPRDGKLAPPPSGPPVPGASGRKRKHDDYGATEDLLKHPVVVKPHPPKLSVKPRSLQPLMVLPREWLPLSCLDLALPHGAFEHARFFESTIRVLELEGRMGARPVILIARLEADQTAYALERQGSQLYSLCKLGSWVDLEQLGRHATVAYTKLIKPRVDLAAQAKDPLPLTTPQLHRETKSRRLAIEAIQSLVKRPVRPPAVALGSQGQETPLSQTEPASIQLSSSATEQVLSSQQDAVPALEPQPDQPPAGSVLESIRNQYCETLYHSMGSLAYFAKGPLSRARAACPMDHDANPNMNNLIEFLKGLILTTVQIDKKYREAVPAIIAKMNAHVADSGDELASKTKQRKAKKMRLGKDGLYPREDEDVRKWWAVHKPRPKDADHVTTAALPQETKLQISCLRTRETQLQMILILEILALESVQRPGNHNDASLPGAPGHGPTPEASKQPPPKKRNKHNLPMLLDVHADRLSIWQTTALDEIKMLEDSQAGQPNEAKKSERPGSDPLRDFCIDIIVPFFSARLPGQCSALNRKLGGPVMPSPSRSKPKRPEPAVKSRSQTGAAKRSSAPKQTRTLERVLSKETERHRRSISRGPGGVIALMRSASTPTLPVTKRETSESAPPTIVPRPDSKDSNHAPFISATRRPSGEKAKKEAQVQAELHDAISGLRKPNREVVGKAMAEAEERRATTTLSQLRKSRKPTQHTASQNVVKATPAGPRFRDALGREAPSQSAANSFAPTKSVEADRVPPSSTLVPSSTPRKRDRDAAFFIDESPALPRSSKLPLEQVAATPVRSSALRQPTLSVPAPDDGVVLASSPVPPKRTQSLGGPPGSVRIGDSGIDMPSSPSDGQSTASAAKRPCVSRVGSLEGFVTVTPVKKRAVDRAAITPIKQDAAKANGSKQLSIYNQLGWDEYDELF